MRTYRADAFQRLVDCGADLVPHKVDYFIGQVLRFTHGSSESPNLLSSQGNSMV